MKRLLTKCALLLALCAALALPALADSVTDTISVCIGYFGWTEDEYVEKAKFSWQELDGWYGGALDTHEEFYSYSNGGGRTYLVYARGFYIRDLLDYAGVMTQCANYGAVAGADRYTGGVAGYTTARSKTKILACKNEASVSSANTGARVSTGSVVGNAQNLIWGGCTAADSALPKLGRTGKVTEQKTSDVCPDYTPKDAPQDAALPDSFTVTFRANGETVGTVTGKKGDKAVKAPALPQMDGYTASWPTFTPTGRDMTISAVYRQKLVSGGAVTKSGTYFILWLASGEIRIAGGLDVTLIGLDSGSGDFDNLTLTVEKGTKLTLQDVHITGDRTLLSLAGGNTLTLLGENRLTGCADASGNACPTVSCGGDLTICGSGSLALQALVNNAAFMGAETSKISIADCTISVFKSDKLGFDGGAFCASGAALTMTNASFFGRTDSDNVAVLSADTINMTGCTVRVESERSVHAVLGSVSLTNCGLYASGHSGSSAKTVSQTAGLDALETVSQQSGMTLLAASGFADIHTEAVCQQDVLFCTDAGLMTGTGNGASATTFEPNKAVTREQLAKFLFNYAVYQGMEAVTLSENLSSFADHDTVSGYAVPAMQWAVGQGFINGTDGKLLPTGTASRCQFAAILNRFTAAQSAKA